MTVGIIGVGLIGGSLALALKDKNIAQTIIGVDINPIHQQKALELKLVDEIYPLDRAIGISDLIIIAMPVGGVISMLPSILDQVNHQVVIDVGSTKAGIVEAVKFHPNRLRFVATHPMWGTENSGPSAAVKNAFINKATVICNKDERNSCFHGC